MKYKAKVMFLHDQLGRVNAGDVFEANAAQIAPVKDAVEVYETKVVKQEPENARARRSKSAPATKPN